MKKLLLSTLLSFGAYLATAQLPASYNTFTDIGNSRVSRELHFQMPSSPSNGFTRSIISNRLYWDGSNLEWRRSPYAIDNNGEHYQPDMQMIRFDGDGMGFYSAGIWDPNLLSFSDASIKSFERMFIATNGNVGIGTGEPSSKLDVNGLIRASGSTWPNSGAGIELAYNAGWGYIQSYDRDAGSWQKLYLGAGQIAIGSKTVASDPDYKLNVDGKIICEELKVELSQNWGDFVFDDDYELSTLKETEEYIIKNKHLPGIPAAQELEINGVELGEMIRLQMVKIEELTLHVIKQNKQIEEQQKQINQLLSK